MSDELDDEGLDLDQVELDGFDEDDEPQKLTLGDVWRDNPMVKYGVIAAAVVVVAYVVVSFGEEETGPGASAVTSRAVSEVKSTPGTEQLSEAYAEAVEERNEEKLEEAINYGTSVIPTPVAPPQESIGLPVEEVAEEDPLQRWRQLQEERLQRELQQTRTLEGPIIDEGELAANEEAIAAQAEVMSKQMDLVLNAPKKQSKVTSLSVTKPTYFEDKAAEALQAATQQAQAQAAQENSLNDSLEARILLPAGEISYAFLITEANSDVEGPVLAQVASGPFNGARILGSFSVAEDRYLTLDFDTLIFNGRSIGVTAIALDPDTTLPGMATEIDNRYFSRVILPVAAGFVEGMASAVAETETSTTSTAGGAAVQDTEEPALKEEIASGIEEAGSQIRSIIDDIAGDVEPLVKIHAGTAIALLFLEDVTEE